MNKTTNPETGDVFTFNKAISSDYHPSGYSYHKDDIPTGESFGPWFEPRWAHQVKKPFLARITAFFIS